jgi:hypothetical protein
LNHKLFWEEDKVKIYDTKFNRLKRNLNLFIKISPIIKLRKKLTNNIVNVVNSVNAVNAVNLVKAVNLVNAVNAVNWIKVAH